MNQNLWSRVLEFLKRKMWNRRWQRAATCLAAVVVFGVTYALVLPAITMTKEYPTLEAKETLVWSGEEMTVKVSAASPAGGEGKTVVLIAEGEGADLSASYAFNEEGICVITDEAGKEIELHRSIREGKKNLVDYWFQLEANEETAFTLQLTDKVDPDRFAETVKAVKETSAEESNATASNAVPAAAAVIAGPTASSSNAQKASASNATGSNADVAEANALAKSGDELIVTEVDDDDKFVEILDGAVINDLETEEDDDGEQTEIVAELKLSAGIGEDYEAAVKDAEKSADKRGDAEIKVQWQDVIAKKAASTKLVSYVNGATIAVFYDENAMIPEGAELFAEEIKEGSGEYDEFLAQTKDAMENATESDASRTVAQARFFDITILDADGNEVEPEAPVKVIVSYDETMILEDEADLNVVHFKTDGTELFKPGTVEGGNEVKGFSFTADTLSVYGFFGLETLTGGTLSAAGNGYEINMTYGPEAEFPKGAKLQVAEAVAGSAEYEEYYQKVLEVSGMTEKPAYTLERLFNIYILSEGQEVQPAAPVQIEIRLDQLKSAAEDGSTIVDDTLSYSEVHAAKTAERIEAAAADDEGLYNFRFDAVEFSPCMILGVTQSGDAEGKIGVTNEDNVVLRKTHDPGSEETGMIQEKGTRLEILKEEVGVFDGNLSRWYQVKDNDVTGYVQEKYISILTEVEEKLEAQLGETKVTVEGMLPPGAVLTLSESKITKDRFVPLFNLNDQALIHEVWPYEISIKVDGAEWQPKDPVRVTVSSPEFEVKENELLEVLLVKDPMEGIPECIVELKDHTLTFEAYGFPSYVFYTADNEIAGGERVRGTAWMDLLDSDFFEYYETFQNEDAESAEAESIESDVIN